MAKQHQTFDSWRLSRIAEEMDALSFSSTDDDGTSTPGSCRSRDNTLERRFYSQSRTSDLKQVHSMEELEVRNNEYRCSGNRISDYYKQVKSLDEFEPGQDCMGSSGVPPLEGLKFAELRQTQLESNLKCDFSSGSANSLTGYCNPREIVGPDASPRVGYEIQTKDALRFIKEKYDSLGKIKVQKPQSPLGLDLDTNCSTSSNHSEAASRPSDMIILTPERPIDRSTTRSGRSWAGTERRQGCRSPGALIDPQPVTHSPFSFRNRGLCISPTSPRLPGPLVHRSGEGAGRFNMASGGRETSTEKQEEKEVSAQELVQVEMFYSSHKTTINVCPCMASMYVGTLRSLRSQPSPLSRARGSQEVLTGRADWTFFKSGIPLLVLDSGEGRRRRRLHFVLAEKGTGFTLWRDTIDGDSDYVVRSSTFHTMYISADRGRLAGFVFDEEEDSKEFYKNVILLSTECEKSSKHGFREGRKKKKSRSKNDKKPSLTKAAISHPCCFTHITRIDGREERTTVIQPIYSPTEPGGWQGSRPLSGSQTLGRSKTFNSIMKW